MAMRSWYKLQQRKPDLLEILNSFLIFLYLPLGQNCSSLTTGFRKTGNTM